MLDVDARVEICPAVAKLCKMWGQELLHNSPLSCLSPAYVFVYLTEGGREIVRGRESETEQWANERERTRKLQDLSLFLDGCSVFSRTCALSNVRHSSSWQLSVTDENTRTQTHTHTSRRTHTQFDWREHKRSKSHRPVVLFRLPSFFTFDPSVVVLLSPLPLLHHSFLNSHLSVSVWWAFSCPLYLHEGKTPERKLNLWRCFKMDTAINK